MSQNSPGQNPLSPFYIALTLVIGMLIGSYFLGDIVRNPFQKNASQRKWAEIMALINKNYVDEINTDSLAELSIKNVIGSLDPHTYYFPAGAEAEVAKTALSDGFEGIGVEYVVLNDTINVISPIADGPSEAAGVLANDKIIAADSTALCGSKVNQETIFKALRGKKGTWVNLKIVRGLAKKPITIKVKRDVIPNITVPSAFMIDSKTGYIKIDRFGEKTYTDFATALENLKKQNMAQLILDLRGNPGGYMDRAIKIVDEFVAGKKLILFTDGKGTAHDEKFFSEKEGLFEKQNLIVLVDEGSASASEIVAGALQDHDRALIVGQRTFGKGLVQQPINLSDGSQLNLTISRYYTPSGRCVQKPYQIGKAENYRKERQAAKSDSGVVTKGKKYKTAAGRPIFGDGGVVPDIQVAPDSIDFPAFLKTVVYSGKIQGFFGQMNLKLAQYKDKNNPQWVNSEAFNIILKTEFLKWAKANALSVSEKEWNSQKAIGINYLKFQILKRLFPKTKTKNIAQQFLIKNDKAVSMAMQNWAKAQAIRNLK